MYKEETMWNCDVSMELNRAIADEHTALAAVLSDLRRQKVLHSAFVNFNLHIKRRQPGSLARTLTTVYLSSMASLQATCRCCPTASSVYHAVGPCVHPSWQHELAS